MKSALSATLTALAIATPIATPAAAQTPATDSAPAPVVVIVRVPKPWYAPKALVASKMRDTIAEYDKLPGLKYKIYTLAQADGRYGGVYLWQDRASAEAWFNPAWFARVEKERGAAGEVRYFTATQVKDYRPGGTPANTHSDSVVTVITLPAAAGADLTQSNIQLRALLPARYPALLREYGLASADGRFGLALLWQDQAAAEQWITSDWLAGLRKTFGAEPVAEWYDAPILTPSTLQR